MQLSAHEAAGVERRAGGMGGVVRAARWAQTYLFVLDGLELAKGRGVVVDGGFAVARWVRRIVFRAVDRGHAGTVSTHDFVIARCSFSINPLLSEYDT